MRETRTTTWHALTPDDALRQAEVDPKTGLSAAEVGHRQRRHGRNEVSVRRGTPPWRKFLQQFNQAIVYVLLAAAVVSYFLKEGVDAFIILAVVVINAIVGFVQESRAEKAIGALSQMMVTEAAVRRGGQRVRVPSVELVAGDIVMLQLGDRVPADMRLIRLKGFRCDESALTGESVPVQKSEGALPAETLVNDRHNMAFAGGLVTGGQAEGVVVTLGDHTETGRIATMIAEAVDLSTPLTRKIAQFSRILVTVILALAAVMFAISFWRAHAVMAEAARQAEAAHAVELVEEGVPQPGGHAIKHPVVYAFQGAVALAVGAIPEGLPAAVTITLAIGVARMARRHAIIRRLPAVETLGSTTVICSDKTGTLTVNQMTVCEVFAGGERFEVSGLGYDPQGQVTLGGQPVAVVGKAALREILQAGLLCNDTHFTVENGRRKVNGDPTEAALLVAAEKLGLARATLEGRMPRRDVIPFDSEHMFMATLHSGSQPMVYWKGSLERLFDRCDRMLDAAGAAAPLDTETIRATAEQMGSKGLRVLAFALKPLAKDALAMADIEEGMVFIGLQAMLDPPREEAIAAIQTCQQAGIKVKMITGDHAATASAIALQLGMSGTRDPGGRLKAVTGAVLSQFTDEELPSVAEGVAVFARVAPDQKLRLVRALQAHGHVVAMTGDGVNDAPALKQADIGIAMGITGTEVAKGAAAMVLTDDNFASIEAAVEEGRNVFNNLVKFITWTLPTNGGQCLILLVAMLLGTDLPITPGQLLWVNMITAIGLGLMLVFEPRETGLMQRPPRDPDAPILTAELIARTALVSITMLVGALLLFNHELRYEGMTIAQGQTTVVNVVVLTQAFYLLNCRSLTRSFFELPFFSNLHLWGGIAGTLLAQLAFTYLPVFHRLFHTAPLPAETWLRIAAVGLTTFVIVEMAKFVEGRFANRVARRAPRLPGFAPPY